MKKVTVIGGGYSGMSAAAYLAKAGFAVDLIEKNSTLGGRGRQFSANGFHFDMGPSWYWMPEVFENFFNDFGYTTTDFYELIRLDPSYRIIFRDLDLDVPASIDELYKLFESIELGSSDKLKQFLKSAQYKYEVGMNEYVSKPGTSFMEYFDMKVFKSVFKLNMFNSLSSEVRKLFKNEKLIQLLEFPVLFLGAPANRIPALYSLMNYADLSLGTWYPKGGMIMIAKAMEKIIKSLGVNIVLNSEIDSVSIENRKILKTNVSTKHFESDFVVCSADYHHFDQKILPIEYRSYTPKYWDSREMAPSSLLFYLGLNQKLPFLEHHNLFFDADFGAHSDDIYINSKWPSDPLFYVCCPSKFDPEVAPENFENLFVLIPLAAGISDSSEMHDMLFDIICSRINIKYNCDIRNYIEYKRSFCVNDFKTEYNAFKGNAYGLSNTLLQTGPLKPKLKSKKIRNLFYTGQLTTPGPGVPPSIISGKVVAYEIFKLNSL